MDALPSVDAFFAPFAQVMQSPFVTHLLYESILAPHIQFRPTSAQRRRSANEMTLRAAS